MKQIILPVTVHLNIRLPLALFQPEPEARGCGNYITPDDGEECTF